LLGAAFDESWIVLSPRFAAAEGDAVAHARTHLARIMLELSKLHQLDGVQLKRTSERIL
jgi:hypothetical protein